MARKNGKRSSRRTARIRARQNALHADEALRPGATPLSGWLMLLAEELSRLMASPVIGYVLFSVALRNASYTLTARVRLLIMRSRLQSLPSYRRELLLRLHSYGRQDDRPAHTFPLERPYPTFQGATCGVM